MGSILNDFENIVRAYERVTKTNDLGKDRVPPIFIRCLAELEDYANESWNKKNSMNKINAKNLGTLRQRIKKNNRDFEELIGDFRKNPEKYEEDVEGEEKVVEEEKPKEKQKAAKQLASSSSEEDSDDWSSDDESTTETSSDDNEEYRNNPAARFLKKPEGEQKPKLPSKREKPARKAQKASDEESETDGLKDEDGWKVQHPTAATRSTTTRERRNELIKDLFASVDEITPEVVLKKLTEIMQHRGRKKTDRKDQVFILEEVIRIVEQHKMNVGVQAKAGFCLLASLFDRKSASAPMKIELWKSIAVRLSSVLLLLETNINNLEVDVNIDDEEESFKTGPYKVKACILTLIERLDDEFTEILQNTDSHGNEYVERLREEQTICELIERVCAYLEKTYDTFLKNEPQPPGLENSLRTRVSPLDMKNNHQIEMRCRAYIRCIEHMYYKFDYEWARSVDDQESCFNDEDAAWASCALQQPSEALPPTPPGLYDTERTKRMTHMCTYIATNDNTDRLRARAILCYVYYLALHEDWNKAKQHLLMSNLQQKIDSADISTKILFNRTMVQMGLCAFRRGQLREAHSALLEMLNLNRVRELLAQGVSNQPRFQQNVEKTAEQELQERKRLLPYHMFINMELIECVCQVSALFLEAPHLAASDMDLRRPHISKHFHRALKQSEGNNLNGPPESMRDHIVAATKALRYGKWKAAEACLINEKMNVKVWNLFFRADRMRAMLRRKVKEESLRCYLLSYSSIYDSISLQRLGDMFHLPMPVVNSIVCKLINKDSKMEYSLKCSLDEPTQSLVMHRGEPARVHNLSLQMADKLSSLQEIVERFAEQKCQGSGGQSGLSSGMNPMLSSNNQSRTAFTSRS
jgi:translation initiation factor 3 subunit C